LITCIVSLVTLGLTAPTFAERAPEEHSQATHVVVGVVAGVYVRNEKDMHHYLVEIAIEKVEKGEGFKPGGTFYVACYLRNHGYYKGKKLTEEEAVYANGRPGRYNGIFPEWYEVVKGK
jgi:hypothetical protein